MPIRVRLTLAFSAALAVLLAAAGLLLYQQQAHSLDRTLNRGLAARAGDVTALVSQADLRESPGGGFAQVLDARGRVFDHTAGAGRSPLLTPSQLARARTRPLLVGRANLRGEPVRLLAVPKRAQDKNVVIVVGTSLRERDVALANLRRLLLIGGPIALLLVSLIGYGLAAAALRPVEQMRARAEALSTSRLDERLPVPPAHDELSRLGRTLNELLNRVEASLEHERSFVADASHELRTPLTLLRAEIELALDRPRPTNELEAVLRSARDEVDRLSQLAEDLLLLARLDRGALPIRTEAIETQRLLAGIAARFEQRAGGAGRSVVVGDGDFLVRADRLRLEQALANLVENALRHGAGDVHLAGAERDGSIELHVRDEGPGFPDEFAARAFERFSRAGHARSAGGAGLGLAIVAEIAAAHGGAAHAKNLSGGGVDVWIWVPQATA
jgi:two-component system OmpR family sensor kinase